LFAHVERLHAGRPWGRVLDAGTGAHSLGWIKGLPTDSWTAISADANTVAALRPLERPADRVLHGVWSDHELLAGERFDVVIADYLLGAIDGFTPYVQDRLFERLRPHVGDRLYAIGLEPWAWTAATPEATAFLELVRLRDAAFLAGNVRPYREFPVPWVLRTLERSGFTVVDAKAFAIVHSKRTIDREHGNIVRQAPRIADPALSRAFTIRADALRARALPLIGQKFGADWVIAAEPR
jgi:hypothetical protein